MSVMEEEEQRGPQGELGAYENAGMQGRSGEMQTRAFAERLMSKLCCLTPGWGELGISGLGVGEVGVGAVRG